MRHALLFYFPITFHLPQSPSPPCLPPAVTLAAIPPSAAVYRTQE